MLDNTFGLLGFSYAVIGKRSNLMLTSQIKRTPKARFIIGLAVWFGVILIAIGVAIVIDRYVPGVRIWQLWPLMIIAVGIKTIFTSGGDGS